MKPRSPRTSRGVQIGLGLAVSIGLIWFAFHDTPFQQVWARVEAMHVLPMLAAVVIATLPFLLRVPRWSLLLRLPDGAPLDNQSLWQAIAIGFAANNTLPLRLGELLRMGAITRLGPVPFATAFASVAVERVLDALTATLLLALALLTIDLPADSGLASKATLVGGLGLALLLVAGIVARWPAVAIRPLGWLLPTGSIRTTLLGLVHRLAAGLAALSDPRRAVPVVLWSVLIWTVNAAGFRVAFHAFDIPVGFAGAVVLQGALLIGIALPSSPGYAGVFEVTIQITLAALFGVPVDLALAYAITYHVLTFIPITLLGVAALFNSGLTLASVREAAT